MVQRLFPCSHVTAALVLFASLCAWPGSGGFAAQPPLIASVVIDANTGVVLHARNANRRVRPASLTKLMTALLVMRALDNGEQSVQSEWTVSARAAAQPASRLGLRSGRKMSVGSVLDAVLVASANDAALVAAEGIAGDEGAFVRLMNQMAAELGMTRTRFANASGLPAAQYTTARDIAVLARHLWRTFPKQRVRYAQTGITHAGRWVGTTNPLLGSYQGARGMKTGFTCRAGFHLVGAAVRNGRTLIAVALGATTPDARTRAIRKLLDQAFAQHASGAKLNLARLSGATGQGEGLPTSSAIIASTCLLAKGPSGWNIDVGVHRSKKQARKQAREFIAARRQTLRGARALSIPRYIGVDLHRAIVTGLDQDRARTACLEFRKQGGSCIIFGADVAAAQLEEAARVRTLAAAYRASAPKKGRK